MLRQYSYIFHNFYSVRKKIICVPLCNLWCVIFTTDYTDFSQIIFNLPILRHVPYTLNAQCMSSGGIFCTTVHFCTIVYFIHICSYFALRPHCLYTMLCLRALSFHLFFQILLASLFSVGKDILIAKFWVVWSA